MRPGQNRRMRGRSRNKGPNPLTRSYESNGPDVKIRGTAQHVADKYSQLARDSQASGDPVAAENYFQHAEHYYRLIAAAQEQYRQQYGLPREEEGDEGDEEGMPFPGGPGGGEEYGEVPNFPQGGYDRNQRFDRNDRQNQNGNRQQRYERSNGERYDRNGGQERFDRQGGSNQDRTGGQGQGGYDRQAGGYDRPNGAERFDRQNGYDRQERPERQADRPPERQERQDKPERQDRRERSARDDRPREDRGGGREGYGTREGRTDREFRRDGRPAGSGGAERDEDTGGNLPAFLTTPVRPAPAPAPVTEEPMHEQAPAETVPGPAEVVESVGIKPRRRRTRKADVAAEPADETAGGA